MTRKTKTGSSRRKGDEYQDLTAMFLMLEAYIARDKFEIFIEYEKAGSLDDVVVVRSDRVDGYQVKHAVKENAVYSGSDFSEENSVVYFKKFANSWQKLKSEFPDHNLTLHLRSNRSLDANLAKLVDDDGYFDEMFREGRYRKEKRILRNAFFEASQLSKDNFKDFLLDFRFDLKWPSYLQLERQIISELLDHNLGITNREVFFKLKRLVEHHAIESTEPITAEILDHFFCDTQTRHLLPQSFNLDKERFVEPPTLKDQLNQQLTIADGEYVVVTGPPGSGKSTGISEYCDQVDAKQSDEYAIVRYYCFIQVNDNKQRLRLEAASLRVNLLTALQRQFPSILKDRTFDFGENRFIEALEQVAQHCKGVNKKLVVFLDGLDHVERDDDIRDSVISALPSDIPSNVVLLIGTQELQHWTPIALKHGREGHHISMPLFSYNEVRSYVVDRSGLNISEELLVKLFEKSSGLPLYLRYITELLSSTENDYGTEIEFIPPTVNGDVRVYYDTLWSQFEAEKNSDAKYLCAVLASLRFSVDEDELKYFQSGIPDTPRFEAALSRVRHLLRRDNDLISIFHNSFRVFVLDQISSSMRTEIAAGILTNLKSEELRTPRWFKHAFHYALEATEYSYIINRVNREFVDEALKAFRPDEEITDGIEIAIEAAGRTSDFVALSRLGVLKYRSYERFEYIFPWSVLAKIYLYNGQIDHVIDSIYSSDTNRIVAGDAYSLDIILTLREIEKYDRSELLFQGFLATNPNNEELGKSGIISYARCLGIFDSNFSQVMPWLERIELKRDPLEPKGLAGEYAPHLAAFIDGLVSSERHSEWRRLKKLVSSFSERLIRHFLIRALSQHGPHNYLKEEIEEYIETFPEDTNIELAFYAAQSALPINTVNRLIEQVRFPTEAITNDTVSMEAESAILSFAHLATALGYIQNKDISQQYQNRPRSSRAVWNCFLEHLMVVGDIVGNDFANREIDWFDSTIKAIEKLEDAHDEPGERTADALEWTRPILSWSLFWLSAIVAKRCYARIIDWIDLLKRLRSSFIWTTHYGIGEVNTDYSFEFDIWSKLAEIPSIRMHLRPVLQDCSRSYEEAFYLKGGSRGTHFLSLAAIAASCGFKNDAEIWLNKGIHTSLAYGYHKDITLQKLIDVLSIHAIHQPERVLSAAADILEMIQWLPNATDGRDTQHFAQYLIPVILKSNRAATLEALRVYYEIFARWQADESVMQYILGLEDGDPEFLWALCGLLNPNNSLDARQHVLKIASSKDPGADNYWNPRLEKYVYSMINPTHWPVELWEQAIHRHNRPERQNKIEDLSSLDSEEQLYQFENQTVTEQEAIEMCRATFSDMASTFEILKSQNQYIPEHNLLELLSEHISAASNKEDLKAIRSFLEKHLQPYESRYWENIGNRFLALGDISSGLECLEFAVHDSPMSDAFNTLVEYDIKRAEVFFVRDMTERLHDAHYHGFDAPLIVANACNLFGKVDVIEQVFDDYLQHCKELFSQWPDEPCFNMLRNWGNKNFDENMQVVNLLIDQLATHAVEFGRRLVFAICSLAEVREEVVFPILCARLKSAEGLTLSRLLQILSRLASSKSEFLRNHIDSLIPMLQTDDLFLSMSAKNILEIAFSDIDPIPQEVEDAFEEVNRRYSSTFAYKGYGLIKVSPSKEFVELTKGGADVSLRRQMEAICDILKLDLQSLTSQLERRLLGMGATLDEEIENVRSYYRAFVHPQGWPVIWFITDFQVRVNNILHQTIHEILVKQRHSADRLEAIWRVIQQGDPEYKDSMLTPMPFDIAPLDVEDKKLWINVDNDQAQYIFDSEFDEEWITVFESRKLRQYSSYRVEYISVTHVCAALVQPNLINNISEMADTFWEENIVTYHYNENLTWKQFREALLKGRLRQSEDNAPVIPFISTFNNHPDFFGFQTLVSLSSKIIRDQDLQFNGFSLVSGNIKVAYFEAWQEGYSDENYTDAPLSFGVRFKVSSDFIEKLCEEMKLAFVIRTSESRFIMKDHQREPEETCSRESFQVWPFPKTP